MAQRDALLQRALERLQETVVDRALQLQLAWHTYRDGEPRKARLGELIADLQAEPLATLRLARLSAVADLLDDQAAADHLVLEVLRELTGFVELARHLSAAEPQPSAPVDGRREPGS